MMCSTNNYMISMPPVRSKQTYPSESRLGAVSAVQFLLVSAAPDAGSGNVLDPSYYMAPLVRADCESSVLCDLESAICPLADCYLLLDVSVCAPDASGHRAPPGLDVGWYSCGPGGSIFF